MFWFLVIGLIAGWLAGKLVKGGGFGLICDLVVGAIGSLTGGYLYEIGGIMTATIGAVVCLWLIRYLYSLMKLYIYNKIELS